MQKQEFLELMQRYEANISIGGSTLRNQGAKGVAEVARNFLAKLDLSKLQEIQPSAYPDILNEWTCNLKQELPKGAKNWGTARKAINVFMIQAFLNRYLAKNYGLEKFKDVLETPLDSYAADGLNRLNPTAQLPEWDSIKRLTDEPSEEYQECALQVAQQKGLARACLDIILWRPKKPPQSGEDRKSWITEQTSMLFLYYSWLKGGFFLMINPKIITKALKYIGKYGPAAIDAVDKIRWAIDKWKKGSSESKPLEEANIQAAQEYEQKIDMCINSLRQHVKVINRNSDALKEHTKIIEGITDQSENLATLVNVLIWATGISFVVAVIAILIALFK